MQVPVFSAHRIYIGNKRQLAQAGISHQSWQHEASDRDSWHSSVKKSTCKYVAEKLEAKRKNRRQKERAASLSPSTQTFICSKCSRICTSRTGLYSHQWACKNWPSTFQKIFIFEDWAIIMIIIARWLGRTRTDARRMLIRCTNGSANFQFLGDSKNIRWCVVNIIHQSSHVFSLMQMYLWGVQVCVCVCVCVCTRVRAVHVLCFWIACMSSAINW